MKDDTQTCTTHERAEGGIVVQLAPVCKYSHRGAGASTEGDTGGFGTDRRCMEIGRLVAAAAAAAAELPQLRPSCSWRRTPEWPY